MIRAETQTAAELRAKCNGKVIQLVAGGASAGTCGGRHVASGKQAWQGKGGAGRGQPGHAAYLISARRMLASYA